MNEVQIIVVLFLIGSTAAVPVFPKELNPDTGLSIPELLLKYGYPLETHEVQTEDGYLLTMHRIPHGINNANADAVKPPVLIMHGLLSSAADWINMGPEKAIALLLADAGFDVWLGNQRGNTYSRKHITLDPDANAAEFYDFSWHEIGIYDLPAKIDHILETTGESSLFYIGHSQGTTSFFVMTSEKPEYNEKIRLMSALAPVAYMSNMQNPIGQWLAENLATIAQMVSDLGIHEFLPHTEFIAELGSTVCADGSELQELCAAVLFAMGGIDSPELDRNFISVITTNTPAGCSIRQGIHYLQEIASGAFGQYDYGVEGNIEKYGQETPPAYDTTKITAPIVLHYSQNDWMAAVVDVEKLAGELPNADLKIVSLPEFSHLDYLWAIDIVTLLNNDIIAELTAAIN